MPFSARDRGDYGVGYVMSAPKVIHRFARCGLRAPRARIRYPNATVALGAKFDLRAKIIRADGVQDFIEQMARLITGAYGSLALVRGERILDIASGR